MAVQLKSQCRDARLNAIETYGGTTCAIRIYTGTQPADCTQANSGSLLVDFNLPTDWMAAASGGVMAKAGTWSGSASGTGTAGHFRIYSNQTTKDGTTCFIQGSVGQGTGDISLDNSSIASGQTVTISTFSLTDANA